MKCKYRHEKHNFECDEDAVKDGWCIFHHPEYWKENSQEVKRKFYEKVRNATKNKKELICIGYHLPEIDLSEKTFTTLVDLSYAEFHGKVNFSKTTFSEVEFVGTKFFETAILSEVKFLEGASFINAQFLSAHFNNVKFLGYTDFSRVSFQEVYFNHVEFTDSVYFNNTKFRKAVFHNVEFHGEVSFDESHFDVCRFIKSRFMNLVLFINSNFSTEAEFKETTFTNADFSDSKFAKLNFSNVEVYDTIKFNRAKFHSVVGISEANIKNAEFSKVKFYDTINIYSSFRKLDFTNAEFHKYIIVYGAPIHERVLNYTIEHMKFPRAKFRDYALFQNLKIHIAEFNFAKFFNTVEFINVEFQKADFLRAKFIKAYFIDIKVKYGSFEGAEFESIGAYNSEFVYANFIYATFEYIAEFREIIFHFANFSRTIFKGIAVFHAKKIQKNSIILFSQSVFQSPENVFFIDFPPTNISFLLTDVSRIKLFCDVNKIIDNEILSERILKISSNNTTEFDNEFINEAIKNLSPYLKPEIVLAEYRSIRKSFENNRTFAEASELFIREMKMLRENLNFHEKVVHIFYDTISRYGESFIRPLIILIVAIFALPVILNLPSLFKGAPVSALFEDYWVNFEATAKLFFQIPVEKHKYGLWEIAIRLLSIILFGNMFIAFRRRLERR